MAWFRVCLSEDEQQVVKELRESHPDAYVRRRMWTLWLLPCGVTRQQTALYVGVDRSTVERFVVEYQQGGMERRDSAIHRGHEHDGGQSD